MLALLRADKDKTEHALSPGVTVYTPLEHLPIYKQVIELICQHSFSLVHVHTNMTSDKLTDVCAVLFLFFPENSE